MYRYTDFDRQFVHQRAAQFRDQLQRHLAGELPDDDFRALRLQNGWYVQRHAPMLRVAHDHGAAWTELSVATDVFQDIGLPELWIELGSNALHARGANDQAAFFVGSVDALEDLSGAITKATTAARQLGLGVPVTEGDG